MIIFTINIAQILHRMLPVLCITGMHHATNSWDHMDSSVSLALDKMPKPCCHSTHWHHTDSVSNMIFKNTQTLSSTMFATGVNPWWKVGRWFFNLGAQYSLKFCSRQLFRILWLQYRLHPPQKTQNNNNNNNNKNNTKTKQQQQQQIITN